MIAATMPIPNNADANILRKMNHLIPQAILDEVSLQLRKLQEEEQQKQRQLQNTQKHSISIVNNNIANVNNHFNRDVALDENELKIKVTLPSSDQHAKLKVVVQLYEVSEHWLTRMYRTVNNVMWTKHRRIESPKPKSNYYFQCLICQRMLSSFINIKGHLNKHLKIHPHECKECSKRYYTKNALRAHIKIKHTAAK